MASASRPRGPSPLDSAIARIEAAAELDRPAAALGALAGEGLASPVLRSLLRGDWLGHAVHPLLSDVVIGTFLSATLLDLLGADEDERARRRLVLAGVAAAIPTALTGTSDWVEEEDANDGIRRAGIVHAMANSASLVLYGASLAGRRRRTLRLAGAAVLGAGAYLGGHLVFVKGSAVDAGPDDERSV
jgi:hypothetical protein